MRSRKKFRSLCRPMPSRLVEEEPKDLISREERSDGGNLGAIRENEMHSIAINRSIGRKEARNKTKGKPQSEIEFVRPTLLSIGRRVRRPANV